MTFGRDTDGSSVHAELLQAIDDHDDDPAPIGDVVHRVTLHYGDPGTVGRALDRLHRRGEIYEPEPAHVRRTGGDG